MRITFLAILLLASTVIHSQEYTFSNTYIDFEVLRRDFSKKISNELLVPKEDYSSTLLGFNINVPILKKGDRNLVGAHIGYARSFPKKWNVINDFNLLEEQMMKSDLISLKANSSIGLGNLSFQLVGGLHLERLWVSNELYFSRLNPGYGVFVSYKCFKNIRLPIPILGVYKIKESDIFWSIRIPVYFFKE